ncbi:MAG: hypothetical protein PHO37_05480 [Kiritimatiellae bacterium]|nr:hypothetical protein [Kiritimatiellia bacterium]
MKKIKIISFVILAVLGMTACASADKLSITEEGFKEPPLALKTTPLWHMNGEMTKEEITAQLKASRDLSGFAGVAVLPVKHTRPEYLTEGYFSRYGDILEASKELGMSVIFYDDVGFPSGTAGGRMKKQFPNDIAARKEGGSYHTGRLGMRFEGADLQKIEEHGWIFATNGKAFVGVKFLDGDYQWDDKQEEAFPVSPTGPGDTHLGYSRSREAGSGLL